MQYHILTIYNRLIPHPLWNSINPFSTLVLTNNNNNFNGKSCWTHPPARLSMMISGRMCPTHNSLRTLNVTESSGLAQVGCQATGHVTPSHRHAGRMTEPEVYRTTRPPLPHQAVTPFLLHTHTPLHQYCTTTAGHPPACHPTLYTIHTPIPLVLNASPADFRL